MSEESVKCCSKRTGEVSTTRGEVLLRLRGGDKAFDCFLPVGTRLILVLKITNFVSKFSLLSSLGYKVALEYNF